MSEFVSNDLSASGGVMADQQPRKDKRTATLLNAGIPQNVIDQGDEAVKNYAKKNNITLPSPPPVPVGRSGNAKPSTEARDKELLKYGIPAGIIAKGDKAIESYAREHGIKLPEKK